MKTKMKLALLLGICFALVLATYAYGQSDIIISSGPRADIQKLYRSFDGGAWEAETVSLAPFDEVTGAALTIDVVHHEVHEGEMFHASYTNSSLGNGSNLDLAIVNLSADAHMVFEVFAAGQVTVYLYESPTLTSMGTAVPTYNLNRTATLTATAQISHTPTVSATGSVALVDGRILPGGTSPQTRVGGGIRQGVEWILAPNKTYLLRINNSSGSSIAVNAGLEWYEE